MSVTSTSASNSQFAATIEALLAQEKRPLNNLAIRRAKVVDTQSLLSSIGTKLSDLRTALDSLRSPGSLSSLSLFTTSTGNSAIVDITANSAASRGTHQVTVSQLAQAHAVGSSALTKTGSSVAAGTYSFSVTVAGTTTSVSVDVSAGDTDGAVLSRVAAAVNSSGAKVNASVVTTDATNGKQKLVFQSAAGGVTNIISNVADTSGGLMSQLTLAGASSEAAYSAATLQQARNAKFNLDGLDLEASSNAVTDALSGVTINLKAKTDTPVQFSIASDATATRKVLDDFVTKFNDLMSFLRSKSAVSEDGRSREALAGDSFIRDLKNSLRDVSSSVIAGAAVGAPQSLADLGVAFARDGQLSVTDGSKFSAALEANPAQVMAVFTGDGGVAGRMYKVVDTFTKTGGGLQADKDLITGQLADMDTKKTRLQARVDARRKQLSAQFARLQDLATKIQIQQQQASLFG